MFRNRSRIGPVAGPLPMVQRPNGGTRAVSLATVKSGGRVRISSISGRRGLRQRLYDLGLYEGATMNILKNDISGPIILRVLDSRIVVGRKQAHRIMVDIVE